MEEEYETWLRDNMPRHLLAQLTANREYNVTMRDQVIDALKAEVAKLEEYRQYLWDVLCDITRESRALRQGGPDQSDLLELHDALDRCVDIATTVLDCDEEG